MQVPQADSSQSKRVGVDEEFIKFRSSPNFQVMKKFIRSKIDKTETSNRSSPSNLPEPPSAEPAAGPVDLQAVADKLEAPDAAGGACAPGGPGGGGADDDEYRSPRRADPPDGSPAEDGARPEPAPDDKPPESTIMCRDFIRGTCKRPGTCRYAHKCDKTQLFNVYTFCRNYQNKVCTLPNCKYVHASVFEEQEFYRTGKLPPHVLAPRAPPPPLPPPPADPAPESRVDIPTSFSNPPPQLPPSVQANSTMFACLPTSATEPRIFQEEFGAARDISYGEPPLKKCKNCDTMDIRYRCLNDLLEKKREAAEEWKRKTAEVEGYKDKMVVILKGLLKLANKSAASGPSSLFNTAGGDKYKILEQLVNLNTNNRISVGSGDTSSTGLLGENFGMASMLANFLSEHQAGTDAARRE